MAQTRSLFSPESSASQRADEGRSGRYHGTVLVWAGMGGGSISLPYLEEEAFGEVSPRMRFYGGMNDSEFAQECGRLGIQLDGETDEYSVRHEGDSCIITLRNAPVYSVVEIR